MVRGYCAIVDHELNFNYRVLLVHIWTRYTQVRLEI